MKFSWRTIFFILVFALFHSQAWAALGSEEQKIFQVLWGIYSFVGVCALIYKGIRLYLVFADSERRGESVGSELTGLVGIVLVGVLLGLVLYMAQRYGIANQGMTDAYRLRR